MYKFKYSIIRDFINLNFKTISKYCAQYGINRTTEDSYARGKSLPPLTFYLDFCNRHCLSPAVALRTDDVEHITDFTPYIHKDKSTWVTIRFNGTKLHDYFNLYYGAVGGATHVDVAKEMGVTLPTFDAWCIGLDKNGTGNIKCENFAQILNTYHLNANDFLHSPIFPFDDIYPSIKMNDKLLGKIVSDMQKKITEQEIIISQMRAALQRKIDLLKDVADIPNQEVSTAVKPYMIPENIAESLKNDTAYNDDRLLDQDYLPDGTTCVVDIIDNTILHIYGRTSKTKKTYQRRKT